MRLLLTQLDRVRIEAQNIPGETALSLTHNFLIRNAIKKRLEELLQQVGQLTKPAK